MKQSRLKILGVLILFSTIHVHGMTFDRAMNSIFNHAAYSAIDIVQQQYFNNHYLKLMSESEEVAAKVINKIKKRTALSVEVIAVRLGFPGAISLLKKRMTINETSTARLQRHLISVCKEELENYDLVARILDLGISPNIIDKSKRRTPLINAAQKGHEKIIDLLLVKGAQINNSNDIGETALAWACSSCRFSIIEQLIAANADLNAKSNATGMTIIQGITNEINNKTLPNPDDFLAIVLLLREAGAKE
jgi:hypothetical protein